MYNKMERPSNAETCDVRTKSGSGSNVSVDRQSARIITMPPASATTQLFSTLSLTPTRQYTIFLLTFSRSRDPTEQSCLQHREKANVTSHAYRMRPSWCRSISCRSISSSSIYRMYQGIKLLSW